MISLVIGTPDSGKSEYAEKLAMKASNGESMAYIATMIPYGDEGQARVEKHKKLRAGKNFFTFEKPVAVDELVDDLKAAGLEVALLECVSNLVGNEIYSEANKEASDDEIVDLIVREILALGQDIRELIVVTNQFEEADDYDKETLRYIKITEAVNDALIGVVEKYHIKTNNGFRVVTYDKDI